MGTLREKETSWHSKNLLSSVDCRFVICRDSSFVAHLVESGDCQSKTFGLVWPMCHGLSVWAYNRFLPISPHFRTRLYGQIPPRRGEVWHSKSPSGTYALTKPFRPTNRFKMRPTATKISMASFTASPITWPMPLMMAQRSSMYNITISITKSFLYLKVSHFLWDSQGSNHHSASTGVLSSSGQHQHRPCHPSS